MVSLEDKDMSITLRFPQKLPRWWACWCKKIPRCERIKGDHNFHKESSAEEVGAEGVEDDDDAILL